MEIPNEKLPAFAFRSPAPTIRRAKAAGMISFFIFCLIYFFSFQRLFALLAVRREFRGSIQKLIEFSNSTSYELILEGAC